MLDRTLTEATALQHLSHAAEEASRQAEIDHCVELILNDDEVNTAITVHPQYRCDLCDEKHRRTRSPFAQLEHPHHTDMLLVRRLAELFAGDVESPRRLIRQIVEGIPALPETQECPDNALAWDVLRGFQLQVESLRTACSAERFKKAATQLARVSIKLLTEVLDRPSAKKTQMEIREAAIALLSLNKALSKEHAAQVAVALGNLFGIEKEISANDRATKQARRGRGN